MGRAKPHLRMPRVAPPSKAMTGVPQAMAPIITSPNGSGQSMGNSRARESPRKCRLGLLVDLTNELYAWWVTQRCNTIAEIVPIDAVYLGGNLQWQVHRAQWQSLCRRVSLE